MPDNPFVFGDPVRKRLFGGREDDIQRIVGRLKTMQSTSVVGERRIGKTSLLYYLSEPSEMEKHGLDSAEYRFVFFSFDGRSSIKPTQFWKYTLRRLARVCKDEEISAEVEKIRQVEEIDPYDDIIEDFFSTLKEKGLKIIFLFDEFEYVTQNVNLDPDFFGILRSLAISRDTELALVTASRRQLIEIAHSDVVGSPFFNIFETVSLKPFNEADARQLIDNALAGQDLFDEREIAYLIELTGCHPYFFQMGCSYLYDAYTNLAGNKNRQARLKTVKDKSTEQAEPHFKYYWGKSRVPEQILLTTIAILSHASSIEKRFDLNNLKKFHQESSNIISGLEERGLVLKKDGQHRIFSPMLEEWIIREIINEKPSEKDYEEWLTDNEGYFAGTRRLYKRAKQITDHIKPKYWGMITEWLSDSENREKIVGWIVEAATTVGLAVAIKKSGGN